MRAIGHGEYLIDAALTNASRPDHSHRERALPLLEQAGDLIGQSSLHNNAGVAAYYAGDWVQALADYRRSGELSGRAGDVVNAARAGNNEAEILSDQGHLPEAQEALEEALRVWRAAHYTIGVALATANLGRVAARARRFDEAHALLDEAAEMFGAIGASAFVHETDGRAGWSAWCSRAATPRRASSSRRRSPRSSRSARAPLLAMLERLAGYALVQARQPGDAARAHLERSLAVARDRGAQYEVALTLRALADTKLAADVDAARRESEDLLEQLGVVSLDDAAAPLQQLDSSARARSAASRRGRRGRGACRAPPCRGRWRARPSRGRRGSRGASARASAPSRRTVP